MRYSLLVLSIMMFWYTAGECQISMEEDSINEKLSTLSGKTKIDFLHALIIDNWLNYPDEAMKYAVLAIELSDSIGDKKLLSKSIRLKGGVHYYLGNYDSTLVYTKESLAIAKAIQDTLLINNALNNLGLVYYNLGNYQNALENLLRALNLKADVDEVYGRAQTMDNIGLVYNKLKDYETARKYFQDALNYARLHDDLNLQLYSLNNIAGTFLAKEQIDKAYDFYQQAEELKVDNKNWNAVTLSGQGQILLHKKSYDLANQYFQQAFALRNEIGDKNGVSEIYYFYAKEALLKQEYDSALNLLGQSQDLAKKIGSKDRMFANMELYVNLYEELGDMDNAFAYQTSLLQLRDTLFNESMARNLADIELKIQEEESKALLTRKDQQLSDSKNVAVFLIIIIVLIFVMLLVILFAFRNNKKINKILARQNQEIGEQKEEILQQKESLLHKNLALEEAHVLIQKQNEKLEKYNEQLLQTVDERTRELEKSNEQLKIANLELDNFLYKSSHDIKGPLATLMGVCNVAMMDITDPEAKKYFAMLAETSKGLNDILARLKTASDVNSLELTLKRIDFKEIFDRCIEQVKNIEGIAKINVRYSVQESIFYEADPFLIDLIVFNMIQNAIKFQEDNDKDFLKIELTSEDKHVIMHFIDNGIGIEEEDTENIFHMYSKSAVKHQSLGLGLYLVKQCVQKLGGEIMLINDADLTHFRIVLPRF